MVQVLLIRPGTTEYDQQGRVQGTLNIPLCEDGRQEVEAMIEELRGQPVAALYTSPCQAAVQTAECLGKTFDLKFKLVDNFENLDFGLWQGSLVADVKTKQPKVYRQWQEQPEIVCPPQGETLCAAKQRVLTSLTKLLKKHRADSVFAIVAPEPLASVIRHVIRQDAWGDLWQSNANTPRWQFIEVPETAAAK